MQKITKREVRSERFEWRKQSTSTLLVIARQDGAAVKRSIGSWTLRNLDPFLLLDEFFVDPPAGFPDHPVGFAVLL